MKKLVHGVGLNDADYVVRTKDGMCKIYMTWANMILRAYSASYHKRKPTYTNVSVCEEWLTFSNFKSWMGKQDYEGKQLDKDILVLGNKVYSPETCIFVTSKENSLFSDCRGARGEYPIGVSFIKTERKYIAYCSENGVLKNLGRYIDPLKAHRAWQAKKISIIKEYLISSKDKTVCSAFLLLMQKIQRDLSFNLETKSYS